MSKNVENHYTNENSYMQIDIAFLNPFFVCNLSNV